MDIKEIIANLHLAFLNQENELALQLAEEAIKLNANNSNAYKCAGNALMSLERYDDAIKNYRMALKYDPANGNRYFDLGFALATKPNPSPLTGQPGLMHNKFPCSKYFHFWWRTV